MKCLKKQLKSKSTAPRVFYFPNITLIVVQAYHTRHSMHTGAEIYTYFNCISLCVCVWCLNYGSKNIGARVQLHRKCRVIFTRIIQTTPSAWRTQGFSPRKPDGLREGYCASEPTVPLLTGTVGGIIYLPSGTI